MGNAEIYGKLGFACWIVDGALMKRVASSSMRRNRANAPVKAAERAFRSFPSHADATHDNVGVRLTMRHC